MTAARFTVDTHLFRELGELLVGRDSTALVELIKNAYDADAEEVTFLDQSNVNAKPAAARKRTVSRTGCGAAGRAVSLNTMGESNGQT